MVPAKHWAYTGVVLGTLLLICGIIALTQNRKPNDKGKCTASVYTWVPVVVASILLLLSGFAIVNARESGKTIGAMPPPMGGVGGDNPPDPRMM